MATVSVTKWDRRTSGAQVVINYIKLPDKNISAAGGSEMMGTKRTCDLLGFVH